MNNSPDIIAEIREDVLKFQRELQQKMIALSKEGLLTERDGKKIESSMQATLDALSHALTENIYGESFREEWLRGIVKIYEDEIVKIIREAENRRYTDKQISLRIDIIKQRARSQTPLPSDEYKRRIESEIAKLEKQLWEDIHGISQKHSRRSQLIEMWLQEFENNVQSLLRPRLNSSR